MRKRREAPRPPHPDPQTEAQLQRIISLRLAVARHEQIADQAASSAAAADRDSARISTYGIQHCGAYAKSAAQLRTTANQAHREIVALHDEIARRIDDLSPSDLAYL